MEDDDILFYEDNKTGKQTWSAIFTILCIILIGRLLAFIDSLLPNKNGTSSDLGQQHEIIISTIFLGVVLVIFILMLVFRYKSKRFSRSITITEKNILIVEKKDNQNDIPVSSVKSYEIIDKLDNYAKMYFNLEDKTQIYFVTRKFDELKRVLHRIQIFSK